MSVALCTAKIRWRIWNPLEGGCFGGSTSESGAINPATDARRLPLSYWFLWLVKTFSIFIFFTDIAVNHPEHNISADHRSMTSRKSRKCWQINKWSVTFEKNLLIFYWSEKWGKGERIYFWSIRRNEKPIKSIFLNEAGKQLNRLVIKISCLEFGIQRRWNAIFRHCWVVFIVFVDSRRTKWKAVGSFIERAGNEAIRPETLC